MSDFSLKYIIVGDSGVGKSCLLQRFVNNEFNYLHDITIGVEFGTKVIKMNNNNIKLQIWDTAGQEAFFSIISSYFRGAIGAIVVFDITCKESFENIKKWINEVTNKSYTPVSIILVGNKIDLENDRVITEGEAYDLAKKYDIQYIETSTKTGYNVEIAFNNLTNMIIKKIKNNLIDPVYYIACEKKGFIRPVTNNQNNNKNCSC